MVSLESLVAMKVQLARTGRRGSRGRTSSGTGEVEATQTGLQESEDRPRVRMCVGARRAILSHTRLFVSGAKTNEKVDLKFCHCMLVDAGTPSESKIYRRYI
jgi:hypothetical protein